MIYRLIIYLFFVNNAQKRSIMKKTIMNLNDLRLIYILLYITVKMSLVIIKITRMIY